MRTVEMAVIALVTVSLGAGGVLAFVWTPPSSPCAGVSAHSSSFTIIESLNGLNGSAHHAGTWPVATVNKCDRVTITIINQDSQAHGFAITSYSNAPVEIVGQDTQRLTFQATRTGQFRMYCAIPVVCTVHLKMQNGLLNVT